MTSLTETELRNSEFLTRKECNLLKKQIESLKEELKLVKDQRDKCLKREKKIIDLLKLSDVN